MTLIQCPECGKDVSSSATACPNCSYPIATPSQSPPLTSTPGTPAAPAVIEATGKRWKGIQVIGALLAIVGLIMAIGNAGAADSGSGVGEGAAFGAVLAMIGLIMVVGGRIGAWWYHK